MIRLTIDRVTRPNITHKFLARSKAYGALTICAEIDSGRNISCFSLSELVNRVYTLAEFTEIYTLVPESAEIIINLQCQRGSWDMSQQQYERMLANGEINY